MARQAPPEVTRLVERFFAARQAGQRVSVDDVLGPPNAGGDDSARVRLRTAVLTEIVRCSRTPGGVAGLTRTVSARGEAAAATVAAAGDAAVWGGASAGVVGSEFPELEGYDLIDVLGRGGMGVVYEAYQRSTGRRVAVKFLSATEQTEAGRRRFEREVELVARLQHPHVVAVIDSGIDRGHYYYVMEYVDGRPLNVALPPGQAPVRAVLEVLATVAEAVDYAHQRGVLHRDLKPSNVLLDAAGGVHLLDFGLARTLEPGAGQAAGHSVTQPGQLVGTLAYMAPEQARGDAEQLSVRSDVYSLGALGYELLTGDLPCRVEGPLLEVLQRIAQAEPPRPATLRAGLDRDVDAILLKALEKVPGGRYATAGELAADLRRYLADEAIVARPSGPARRVARWVRRHRAVASVSAVAVVALLVTTTVYLVQMATQRERAARVGQFFVRNFGFATPDIAKRATVERRDLCDYAAGRVAEELAGYPLEQATVHQALGLAYLELSLPEEARGQLEQALTLRRRELGEEHAETAETMHALALVLHRQGEYEAARQYYEAALRVRERTCGAASAPVAETLNNLGWLAKDRGDYDEAAARYAAALELRRKVCGSDHPAVAETLNDLAHLHYVRGQYAEAERAFRAALDIRLRLYPDRQNTHVAATLASLGSVLNKLGRYAEAGPLLAEALQIRERVCGTQHADTLVSRNEWGLHLLETGQYAAAAEVLRENLRLREEVHGPRHRLVAVSVVNLALALHAEGAFEEAERLERRALELLTEIHGRERDHADVAAVLTHLACTLSDAAGAVGQDNAGVNHEAVGQREAGALEAAQRRMATAQREEEALEVARRALAMRQRLAPEQRGAALGQAWCVLGHVQLGLGRLAEARESLERGTELLAAELPGGHWRLALARSDLGECLARQGDRAAAGPLLAAAADEIEAAQGLESRFSVAARARVVRWR